MAEYEDLVELGFEGVDKFANKYHDRAYNHLPEIPGKKKQRHQNQRDELDNRHDQERQHLEHKQRHERGEAESDDLSDLRSTHTEQRADLRGKHQDQRKDLRDFQEQQKQQWQTEQAYRQQYPTAPPTDTEYTPRRSAEFGHGNGNGYHSDRNMYAPDRQQREYRNGSDDRYYEDERVYYKGPNAGTVVPQTRAAYENMRNQQVAPYQQQSQREFDDYYDNHDRSRSRPQYERRSSSWSPPRSDRRERRDSDRRDRDKRDNRSRSRSNEKQHRILATVGGALVGGLVANQARKGKSHDTTATVIGAIVGGVGAREASEYIDQRRRKRERVDEKWEEKYGDDERQDNRNRDDNYEQKHKYDLRY